METDDLIRALGADAGPPRLTPGIGWTAALVLAVLVAAAVFVSLVGPRPDIAAASESIRFLFKFVVTILLGVTAFPALVALSRPQGAPRATVAWLALAPLLLVAAIACELAAVPSAGWGARLLGSNGMACLALIPLIGAGPLALFITALRNAAPSRPALAGAVAGIAAGGIAATLYAAHCTDDSPLFVALWYTLAVAVLAAAGAVAGRKFARW